MSPRLFAQLFAELCGTTLVAVSVAALIIAYLLLTGNLP